MERDLPPSGADDRLSDSANRLTTPGELRVVRDIREGLDQELAVDWDRVSETLGLYRRRFGMPSEILDLSVDELTARRLATSCFASVVRVRLDPSAPILLPSAKRVVADRLVGRDPNVVVSRDYLVADFQMEDDSDESQLRAARFACTLALLVGGLPGVRVGRYRDPENTQPKGFLTT